LYPLSKALLRRVVRLGQGKRKGERSREEAREGKGREGKREVK
jgi:hypothetical protein